MSVSSLQLSDIDGLCDDLARRIRVHPFTPSWVLYIDRAGKYLGMKLAAHFRCTVSGISASREGARTKAMLRPILRLLPERLAHELRRIELASGFHAVNKSRHVRFLDVSPGLEDDIAVVDDAVDSGYSMLAVLDFLEARGYDRRKIVTVAVTVTGKQPIHRPDVSLYDYLVTFPWSVGSRHYDTYLEYERRMLRS